MEMSQGNSLYIYLKQTKMSFFFFYKIGGQEDRPGPARGRGIGPSGRGKEVEKVCGRVSTVKYHVYVFVNGKIIPVETTPGMEGGEGKGE
jgi:hypothetical protein